mmetsp:Transcript_120859/g.277126  ORF Transcript_120859/g.277126 Transcript_120859/m.277126 type:complete len:571 (+) Transcript_120859:25-1737(+)
MAHPFAASAPDAGVVHEPRSDRAATSPLPRPSCAPRPLDRPTSLQNGDAGLQQVLTTRSRAVSKSDSLTPKLAWGEPQGGSEHSPSINLFIPSASIEVPLDDPSRRDFIFADSAMERAPRRDARSSRVQGPSLDDLRPSADPGVDARASRRGGRSVRVCGPSLDDLAGALGDGGAGSPGAVGGDTKGSDDPAPRSSAPSEGPRDEGPDSDVVGAVGGGPLSRGAVRSAADRASYLGTSGSSPDLTRRGDRSRRVQGVSLDDYRPGTTDLPRRGERSRRMQGWARGGGEPQEAEESGGAARRDGRSRRVQGPSLDDLGKAAGASGSSGSAEVRSAPFLTLGSDQPRRGERSRRVQGLSRDELWHDPDAAGGNEEPMAGGDTPVADTRRPARSARVQGLSREDCAPIGMEGSATTRRPSRTQRVRRLSPDDEPAALQDAESSPLRPADATPPAAVGAAFHLGLLPSPGAVSPSRESREGGGWSLMSKVFRGVRGDGEDSSARRQRSEQRYAAEEENDTGVGVGLGLTQVTDSGTGGVSHFSILPAPPPVPVEPQPPAGHPSNAGGVTDSARV